MLQFLEEEIWPLVPAEELASLGLSKQEREEVLGIGRDGA